MKKIKNLFASPHDLMILYSISYSSALRKRNKIKEFFDKSDHQQITWSEVLEYEGLSEDEVIDKLFQHKKTGT